jgi:hypothetical protein
LGDYYAELQTGRNREYGASMKCFDEYMKHFSDIEGWFQTPAIAIWDSLLSYQQERQISGNLLEIGVWKGKSAALAALHCQSDDACVFVDAMPLDEAKARKPCPAAAILRCPPRKARVT